MKRIIRKFRLHKYLYHVYDGFRYILHIASLLLMDRWFEFYQTYFDLCMIIRRKKSDPEQFRRRILSPFMAIIVLTISASLKLIYNYYYNWNNEKLDKIWPKINADIVADANLHRNTNLFLIFTFINCDIIIYLLYFKNPTVQHLKSIIIDHRNDCFHWPYRYRSMMAINHVVGGCRKIFHRSSLLFWVMGKRNSYSLLKSFQIF